MPRSVTCVFQSESRRKLVRPRRCSKLSSEITAAAAR